MSQTNTESNTIHPLSAFIDLAIFLGTMFLVRTFEIEFLGFWGNALFKSIATVGVATGLLYFRKQSWKSLGLTKPDNYLKMLGITVIILVGTVVSIMIFELIFRDLLFGETPDPANSNFDKIKGNLPYLLGILPLVWLESFLEELQDRGFSLNRFESVLSKVPIAAILAALMQALVFGFRHSYDFSPRSMTTGLIGLVFGLVYIFSGRNLWPLILAHIVLNSMSMIGRL